MEPPFDELQGVISTTSGYTGGHKKNPTYEEVSSGGTGHAESVEVVYDPTKITYAQLLDVFWKNIDPITRNRQFCDAGTQYRSAIYYHDEEQKRLAEASKKALENSGRFKTPIVTEIAAASPFSPGASAPGNDTDARPARKRTRRRSRRLEPGEPDAGGLDRPAASESPTGEDNGTVIFVILRPVPIGSTWIRLPPIVRPSGVAVTAYFGEGRPGPPIPVSAMTSGPLPCPPDRVRNRAPIDGVGGGVSALVSKMIYTHVLSWVGWAPATRVGYGSSDPFFQEESR